MFGSKLLGAALAAITLLGAAQAQATPKAAAPTVIPLSLYLGQLLSFDAFSGGKPRHFLLDTAGGLTVVTPAFAQSIGCKPWGQVTGFRMRGDRIDSQRCDDVGAQAAGLELGVPTAGVFDFGKLLPKDAPPLDGSVALDAFAGRAVTLDIAHMRLVVETPASLKARIRGATEIPVRFSRDGQGLALTPLVAVQTTAGRLWMEFDSGSDGAVIVNRPYAALLGLDPAIKGGQDLKMTLAGGVAVAARGQVQDLILDGNIGVPVLRRWAITLDLAHQRLWLKPVAKP